MGWGFGRVWGREGRVRVRAETKERERRRVDMCKNGKEKEEPGAVNQLPTQNLQSGRCITMALSEHFEGDSQHWSLLSRAAWYLYSIYVGRSTQDSR